jgi:hypothetical protein
MTVIRKDKTMSDSLDLSVALKKMHELGLADGDLGYAYWYAVAKLLKDAKLMAGRICDLEAQVARLAANSSEGGPLK